MGCICVLLRPTTRLKNAKPRFLFRICCGTQDHGNYLFALFTAATRTQILVFSKGWPHSSVSYCLILAYAMTTHLSCRRSIASTMFNVVYNGESLATKDDPTVAKVCAQASVYSVTPLTHLRCQDQRSYAPCRTSRTPRKVLGRNPAVDALPS